MGLVVGIFLLAAGLVLITGVGDWATPILSEPTLGWILLVGGVLAIAAGLLVSERQPPSPLPRRPKE